MNSEIRIKSSTLLRWCLALEWVFIAAGITVSTIMESSLPEPLTTWLMTEAEADITIGDIAFVALAIPLLISAVVATVGLFCLRRWAAWLYLITTVLGMLLTPFTGPVVEHPLADMFDEFGIIMIGMVLALTFFTDSLKKNSSGQSIPPPLAQPSA